MPRVKQSKGKCSHCGLEIAKGGVTRHLSACSEWKELLTKAERKLLLQFFQICQILKTSGCLLILFKVK